MNMQVAFAVSCATTGFIVRGCSKMVLSFLHAMHRIVEHKPSTFTLLRLARVNNSTRVFLEEFLFEFLKLVAISLVVKFSYSYIHASAAGFVSRCWGLVGRFVIQVLHPQSWYPHSIYTFRDRFVQLCTLPWSLIPLRLMVSIIIKPVLTDFMHQWVIPTDQMLQPNFASTRLQARVHFAENLSKSTNKIEIVENKDLLTHLNGPIHLSHVKSPDLQDATTLSNLKAADENLVGQEKSPRSEFPGSTDEIVTEVTGTLVSESANPFVRAGTAVVSFFGSFGRLIQGDKSIEDYESDDQSNSSSCYMSADESTTHPPTWRSIRTPGTSHKSYSSDGS